MPLSWGVSPGRLARFAATLTDEIHEKESDSQEGWKAARARFAQAAKNAAKTLKHVLRRRASNGVGEVT